MLSAGFCWDSSNDSVGAGSPVEACVGAEAVAEVEPAAVVCGSGSVSKSVGAGSPAEACAGAEAVAEFDATAVAGWFGSVSGVLVVSRLVCSST